MQFTAKPYWYTVIYDFWPIFEKKIFVIIWKSLFMMHTYEILRLQAQYFKI